MAEGFFALGTLSGSGAPQSTIAQCGACGLLNGCRSPKMAITGNGRRGILIVGEAPSKDDDDLGKQFVGPAGGLLRDTLRTAGIDPNEDCWFTNALSCHPPKSRAPTDKEVEYCRPLVVEAIQRLQPQVIILLGLSAIRSVMDYAWRRAETGTLPRWAGWQIPCQKLNAWICPTYAPREVLRSKNPVAAQLFTRHLTATAAIQARPWQVVPNYPAAVEVVTQPSVAAGIIREMVARGGPMSFDYETNALKPETPGARIYSCAINWQGRRTIAYPWHGDAITATEEFLVSPHPKIGFNIKFEERWTRATFGHGVRNWRWCGQLAAHSFRSCKGTKACDFQAFARYGQPSWDDHIHTHLHSEPNTLNRIDRIGLRDLLQYNGIDALMEFMVAVAQWKEMGFCPIQIPTPPQSSALSVSV